MNRPAALSTVTFHMFGSTWTVLINNLIWDILIALWGLWAPEGFSVTSFFRFALNFSPRCVKSTLTTSRFWKTVSRSLLPSNYRPGHKPFIKPPRSFSVDHGNRRSETAIAFVKVLSTYFVSTSGVDLTTLSMLPSSISKSSASDEDCRAVSSSPHTVLSKRITLQFVVYRANSGQFQRSPQLERRAITNYCS